MSRGVSTYQPTALSSVSKAMSETELHVLRASLNGGMAYPVQRACSHVSRCTFQRSEIPRACQTALIEYPLGQ